MSFAKTLGPYLILGLLNIVGGIMEIEMLRMVTKPLLMPALAFFYLQAAPETPLNRYVFAALGFAWLGDVLLMLVSSGSIFFIMGLTSFLLAHIIYIMINLSAVHEAGQGFKPQWQDIPFLLYGFLIFGLLKDNLGEMYFPALAYAVVICIMALTARKRWKRTDNQSFWLIMGGALVFVMSDTFLAFNRFAEPIVQADLIIMSTYIVAQLLIVYGLIVFLQKIPREAGS